jgi:3-dehydroquinate synthase
MDSGDIVVEVMEMPEGEDNKTIDICTGVWEALAEYYADRKSLLINLGGGVVTDLGGFVASTFMRGIDYINVPTSLLAMVDASVGGKTGVDLGHLKNLVGVINEGSMVLVDTSFLETLPQNHMVSGYAEMLKHGLIFDEIYYNKLSNLRNLDFSELDSMIYESIKIKNTIVAEDPTEKGLRKILNYGHTLGHAIESYFLNNGDKTPLLHGEAIAIGMILETYLSHKICGLSQTKLSNITNVILASFKKVRLDSRDIEVIMDLLKHDKKNSHGKINFVLLEDIGKPVLDCEVSSNLILEAFSFYDKV